MSEDGLGLAWLALGLTLALLALFAWLWGRGLWRHSGLPEGSVIASDMGNWYPLSEPLYAPDLQLTGKPDYLVQRPDGSLVPVEIKSTQAPNEPYEGHILQLAAYCLLVEDVYNVRPECGIIQYRDRAFAVEYTLELEDQLLDVLAEMRDGMFVDDLDRDHDDRRRCAPCGLRDHCSQRLA